MKSTHAIIFLMLYGLALIRPAFPLVDYYLKLGEYKRNCVNKATPQMHCNGQCILMTKLQTFNIQQQEPVAPAAVKINFKDYPVGICEALATTLSLHFSISVFENPRPIPVFITRYTVEVFHPPSYVLA